MKTQITIAIVSLLVLLVILWFLIATPSTGIKECELSLCDCKCYEKGQTPEEKGSGLCGINCLGEYGISGCKLENNECKPIVQKQCEKDEDCVPTTCCHPNDCVNVAKKPDCKGIVCTMECRPGTMDCGQGQCGCVNNQCQVVWSKE